MTPATLTLLAVLSFGSMLPALQQAPAATAEAAVKIPETAPGRALTEFIASFNAGGEKRRTWVQERTTLEKDQAEGILKQDAEILSEHGAATVVRLPEVTDTTIGAVIRHASSGAHGYLTLTVEKDAPHKVTNMQIRPASPEEIKGGV